MSSLLKATGKKYRKYEAEILDVHFSIEIYVLKKNPWKCVPSLSVLNDCDLNSA